MKTFKIENGDIAVDKRGRVKEIDGASKVVQDLKNWLLNDIRYNKWHPQMGTRLDNYVGQPVSAQLIMNIKEEIRTALNHYTEEQMADLKKRIDESSDPYTAIGLAEPSSIVRTFTALDVYEDYGNILVRIGFTTHTDDYEEITLAIAGGLNDRGVI